MTGADGIYRVRVDRAHNYVEGIAEVNKIATSSDISGNFTLYKSGSDVGFSKTYAAKSISQGETPQFTYDIGTLKNYKGVGSISCRLNFTLSGTVSNTVNWTQYSYSVTDKLYIKINGVQYGETNITYTHPTIGANSSAAFPTLNTTLTTTIPVTEFGEFPVTIYFCHNGGNSAFRYNLTLASNTVNFSYGYDSAYISIV